MHFLFRRIVLQVSANIIAMYPATSLFVAVGQLAIAILVLFSYPLQVQPCRNCLDKVFHFGSAIDKAEEDVVEDEHMSGEMTPLKYTVLTSAIVAGGFSIAYFVDNLEMGVFSLSLFPVVPIHATNGIKVLSFVGSTGSTTISFILPGLFYWKASTPNNPSRIPPDA